MENRFTILKNKIKGDVLIDDYSLGMYATDASIYQITPKAAVIPKNEKDVKMTIKFAYDNGITILPRGAGTSLAGQTVGASIVLDFSKFMNSIIEINAEEKWVKVKGHATFHHPLMVHGSNENNSVISRRAFVLNVFADGTVSNTDDELLSGVPIIKKGNKMEESFFHYYIAL